MAAIDQWGNTVEQLMGTITLRASLSRIIAENPYSFAILMANNAACAPTHKAQRIPHMHYSIHAEFNSVICTHSS